MSRAVDYWKERARKEEELSRKRDRNISKELEDLHNLYIKEIEKQIYAMEKRFAEKKGLTVAELKKLTDQYDVQAFNARAAKYVKERNFTDEANRELSWYNFTMRLNRLEAIKAELSLEMLALASEEAKVTGSFLDAEYLYRLKSQANILGVSIPTDLTLRNKAKAIVDSNFEGAVWSERIWGRQQKLRDLVVKTVSDLLILGKNPTTAIPAIRRAFDVSVFEAKRLAVTEGARVAMAAQKNIMKANGFDYYIYLPETSACKICKPLDEKVFRLDDMQSGKNAPPMHPFCKCTIASHYVDEKKPLEDVEKTEYNESKHSGAISKARGDVHKQEEAFAERYYEQLRNSKRSNIVGRMVQNSGVEAKKIEAMLTHLLDNKYLIYDSFAMMDVLQHFYPDYDIARSLQRLHLGGVLPKDIVMVEHEALEYHYMNEEGLDYEEAHRLVNLKFNYEELLLNEKTRNANGEDV